VAYSLLLCAVAYDLSLCAVAYDLPLYAVAYDLPLYAAVCLLICAWYTICHSVLWCAC
jgi:hypothetical protein